VNEANTKKSVQAEMNYEFEQKQTAEKAEQDKKDAIVEQDRKKQEVIRNSFIAGFLLMLALAFFIFRGYRQKQKANEIITQQKEEVEKQKTIVEQQKALVEEKNKDILDSITYAKRLQDAILPPLSIINQYLPESFVLYKPKDIVAGDFYWMERVGDTILIAAADCTGHGVPGALVSVVCSNALNRTVKEFKITEPGKILDKVRELVLETFEKSESNVQDGMDISLCCLNMQTREMQWSGANNALWYIQNNELKEINPDKQPIGKTDKPAPFNTHKLQLQKGDTLYLFTDGYADQFGGEKGKKFKYKQLQQLITDNAQSIMEKQKAVLENKLNEWKGNLEQVDDVLVIGIRV
jgi:serine phosphatase RsbU (regulator of sigma subunit)